MIFLVITAAGGMPSATCLALVPLFFQTRSTAKSGVINADTCSACHPFYTGKQRILDTGGRVARFEQRFGKAGKGAQAPTK